MKILSVIHADFELPGAIDLWVKHKQFDITICRPFAGESLPKTQDFDWLILMGGPQSPLEQEIYPYLKDEIRFVKAAHEADKVILGFCLGAQIIGEAFGARTEKSPNREVGIFPIELTDAGKRDPLFKDIPHQFSVVHWHNDMPGLTNESEILAVSEGCPRQVVRYRPKVYGFQCHPEPTISDIQNMIFHCEDDLRPGDYVQTKEEMLQSDFAAINKKMLHILDNLLAYTNP